MSSVTASTPAAKPPAPEDPFRFGWRDVRTVQPDGTVVIDQIPLTLEDVLHPHEGDVTVENSWHERTRTYLSSVAQAKTAADPAALILSDCKIVWDDRRLKHHSPDLAVLFGVRALRDKWYEFDVAEQGVRPRLLLEVVSPNTRANDVVTKLDHYFRAKVPLYVIVDQEVDGGPIVLRGFRYTKRRYVPMALDERDRLWLEPLNLWLTVRDGKVVGIDGETEEELGNYTAVSQALHAEHERADAEQQRADAEQERANAAKVRADRAEQAQAALTAQLNEMEAELRRLRGER